MQRPDLQQFRQHLVHSGVLPRHVKRLVTELSEHYEDLEAEESSSGLDPAAAALAAKERLGDLRLLAQAIICKRELQRWPQRYPGIARVVLPVAWLMTLPAVPIIAGAANAVVIARWGACLLLGGAVTCALLLAMQLSITL